MVRRPYRRSHRAPHRVRRTVIGQCVAFFIIEDFYFYWIHRFLHWDAIYQYASRSRVAAPYDLRDRYVHKVHHLHAAPFGIAAEARRPAASCPAN